MPDYRYFVNVMGTAEVVVIFPVDYCSMKKLATTDDNERIHGHSVSLFIMQED
jgi:hypothetical protein